MSYQSTKRVCTTLNTELQRRFENGSPYMLAVNGRPSLEVLSWDPFAYENYGRWYNRAPIVAGQLALRAIISAPTEDDRAVLFYGVEGGQKRYGFMINTNSPMHLFTANRVIADLGHPEFYMTGRG